MALQHLERPIAFRWAYQLTDADTRSILSLSSLLKVAIEVVSMSVWLNLDFSRPQSLEHRPISSSKEHSIKVDLEVSDAFHSFYDFSVEGDCWPCLSSTMYSNWLVANELNVSSVSTRNCNDNLIERLEINCKVCIWTKPSEQHHKK